MGRVGTIGTIKKIKGIFALAVAAGVLLPGLGCRNNQSTPPQTAHYSQIDTANSGAIEGTIHLAGKAPARVVINMAQDPGCAAGQGLNKSEGYIVNDGKMANVFVYLKDGLGNRIYAAPASPVVIDQQGCRYLPHVVGLMVGQPLEVRNSDPTMHDVNVQPDPASGNQASDGSQGPHGSPLRRTFSRPEPMIALRCSMHPWMEAYINVASNPFFAVSDAQGHYTIRGLPPGTYTVAADQENLGTQQQVVTVMAHQTAPANFAFNMGKH